jgi:hypothetical protein
MRPFEPFSERARAGCAILAPTSWAVAVSIGYREGILGATAGGREAKTYVNLKNPLVG